MSKVKAELDELFLFLKEFENETGVRLVIVLFVDDLDRCLGGRNVKVLEAIQLMLSIPGVPILVFLAIDSRVVVASIEESFGEVLRDAYISGWEVMPKAAVPSRSPSKYLSLSSWQRATTHLHRAPSAIPVDRCGRPLSSLLHLLLFLSLLPPSRPPHRRRPVVPRQDRPTTVFAARAAISQG